ncbi:hypothetical protein Tcan_02026 [Toxocara canis]|uniref:Uncharacterized protein n=1 Tax=Toxocara canis TaxID=6265 RepID=A0A0B2W3X7_TOXCA|nr:hypothetical protein Tcan_02026 [Toxocara canis]
MSLVILPASTITFEEEDIHQERQIVKPVENNCIIFKTDRVGFPDRVTGIESVGCKNSEKWPCYKKDIKYKDLHDNARLQPRNE